MSQKIDTVIIGGGQAGLSTSYFLKQQNREHIVLEQAAQAGNVWRNERWDSFTLVTPNWMFRLPGAEYEGSLPGAFMSRVEVVAQFDQYVERFQLPMHYNVTVTRVEPDSTGIGYLVLTEEGVYEAHNVVIATGLYQKPKKPSFSADLAPQITQINSGQYRNPQALSPGAVLVVGSGQSGCQIAEELYQNGRQVYLCTSSAGRVPRRYRGKDIFEWLSRTGFLARPVNLLPSPRAKFAAIPHLTGRDGGHTLNLHQFASDGVTLLGHLRGGEGTTVWAAADLKENLAKEDGFETQIVNMIDAYITRSDLDIPEEEIPSMRDAYAVGEITELNLEKAGIKTIIYAIGYSFDFSLIKFPVCDGDGYPIQNLGVTAHSGLFFAGQPWLSGQKSGLLFGVGEQAEIVAATIAGRMN